MHRFSQLILKLVGWKAYRTVDEPLKSVICLAPHTSNWDFIISKIAYHSMGSGEPCFFMKKSWFFFPLGLFLRAIGGIPVDRKKSTSLTDQVAEEFAKHEQFHIGITPEGTRKAVSEWKKGFYHIAVKAGVPIQLAHIDYAKKECAITEIFYPTGNDEQDLAYIRNFYAEFLGKHPERYMK